MTRSWGEESRAALQSVRYRLGGRGRVRNVPGRPGTG